MRFCCIAQGTISNLLGQTMMEDNRGKKRIHIYIYTHTYIHIYIHTHTHTHTHTYIHIYMTGPLCSVAEIDTTLLIKNLKNKNNFSGVPVVM